MQLGDWVGIAGVFLGAAAGVWIGTRLRQRLGRKDRPAPLLVAAALFVGATLAEDAGTALLGEKPGFFLVKYALVAAVLVVPALARRRPHPPAASAGRS